MIAWWNEGSPRTVGRWWDFRKNFAYSRSFPAGDGTKTFIGQHAKLSEKGIFAVFGWWCFSGMFESRVVFGIESGMRNWEMFSNTPGTSNYACGIFVISESGGYKYPPAPGPINFRRAGCVSLFRHYGLWITPDPLVLKHSCVRVRLDGP